MRTAKRTLRKGHIPRLRAEGNTLDVFSGDAFSAVNMTEAINLQPATPHVLGQTGMFVDKPSATSQVTLEYLNGELRLVQSAARGTLGDTRNRAKRNKKIFQAPYLPEESTILAAQIQDVVPFGATAAQALENVASVVNEELQGIRNDFEATHEYHRVGAINGVVLDADGSVLYNILDEFNIVQDTFIFAFATATEATLQLKCVEVVDKMKRDVGSTVVTGVEALVDDIFFQNMLKSPSIRSAWERHSDRLRVAGFNENEHIFQWGGINWNRYSASVGGRPFIGDVNVARFYPMGMNIFRRYNTPGDFIGAVNRPGLPFYAMQKVMDFGKGVEIHAESCPLHICTRPVTLKKGTST